MKEQENVLHVIVYVSLVTIQMVNVQVVIQDIICQMENVSNVKQEHILKGNVQRNVQYVQMECTQQLKEHRNVKRVKKDVQDIVTK